MAYYVELDVLQPVGVQIHDKAAARKPSVITKQYYQIRESVFLCDLYRIGRPLFKWELNFCRLQGGMYITWLGQIHRVRSCACILCGDKTDEMYPYSIAILLQAKTLVCTTIHCGKTKSTRDFGDGINGII